MEIDNYYDKRRNELLYMQKYLGSDITRQMDRKRKLLPEVQFKYSFEQAAQ